MGSAGGSGGGAAAPQTGGGAGVPLLGCAGDIQGRHDGLGGLPQHGGDVEGTRRGLFTLSRPDGLGHLREGHVAEDIGGPIHQVFDQRLARAGVLAQLILRPLDVRRDGVGEGGGHAVKR